jgi:hypothetical protein
MFMIVQAIIIIIIIIIKGIRSRDARRITAAETKYLRKTSVYIWKIVLVFVK